LLLVKPAKVLLLYNGADKGQATSMETAYLLDGFVVSREGIEPPTY
jgi:hypothetical protein